MIIVGIVLCLALLAQAGPATELAYKGQFCTDPRTMRKHAAYTEWADAYSCTRHRCQPGGRNLAIYTVGCKRVEAPESAIECEEVVEDTNMQFPYCCTRLRCLVVVRGEVWTRVLGQPWENLPAAPWSHMYKMKKPPPADGGAFSQKKEEGPVYELSTSDNERDMEGKVLRTSKKDEPECNDAAVARAAPPLPSPDIVIALSTGSDKESERKKEEEPRHFVQRKPKDEVDSNSNTYFEEAQAEPVERADDMEEAVTEKEKVLEPQSEERYYANPYVTQAPNKQAHQVSWTELPQSQWNDGEPVVAEDQPQNVMPMQNHQRNTWNEHASENMRMAPEVQSQTSPAKTWEHQSIQADYPTPTAPEEKKVEKPGNLQTLVDAIGTRMRDIENVVARMSEKVHQDQKQVQADTDFGKGEQNLPPFRSFDTDEKYHDRKEKAGKMKIPNLDGQYKSRASKYLHSSGDITTEQPLFVEDANLNGYYSDASNSLLTRRKGPKEPPATYMAPVEIDGGRRKAPRPDSEPQKKRKKRIHKKKRVKGHHKKHHGKEDKRRKFRLNSVETDRQTSLEDNSAGLSNTNNSSIENLID